VGDPGLCSWFAFRWHDTSIERVVVSSMPVGEHEELSPSTELGQAVEGVELGATVQYDSPRGLVEVVVEEIQN